MPLPPALAAKLAKRGIISATRSAKNNELLQPSADEEIIAEDYDENPTHENANFVNQSDSEELYTGYYGCPNKWNVFHECNTSCRELWKQGRAMDTEYNRKRMKMLLKYPLPSHWQEVLDVGIGRFYYWNMETDLVSWLPPGHPRCRVSLSAATLRCEMIADRSAHTTDTTKEDDDMNDDYIESDSSKDSDDEEQRKEASRKETFRRDRGRDRRGSGVARRGRRPVADDLDPMDPASYGECPRGSWSSGLQQHNEAKTGVDVTASGPLFQMRPYPAPGAVLRANASSGGGPAGPKKPNND